MKYLQFNWLIFKINHEIAKNIAKYVDGSVLDIGCGEKPYFDVLKPHINEYVGLGIPNALRAKDEIDIYGDVCNLP